MNTYKLSRKYDTVGITSAIATYFSDKQTYSLMDIDNKINELDTYIKECELEMNEFNYNSEDAPIKISLYSFPEGERYGFIILMRMVAVLTNISNYQFYDFSTIEVSIYFGDHKVEKVPMGIFSNKVNKYLCDTFNDGQIPFSNIQINNMLMNIIDVKYNLNETKNTLIKEKNQYLQNQKNSQIL